MIKSTPHEMGAVCLEEKDEIRGCWIRARRTWLLAVDFGHLFRGQWIGQ